MTRGRAHLAGLSRLRSLYCTLKYLCSRDNRTGRSLVLCQTSSDRLHVRLLSRSLKGKGGHAAHGTRQFKPDEALGSVERGVSQ